MGQLLFKKMFFDAIRGGTKRTTIRRWRTPRVRAGERAWTPGVGWLTIESVERLDRLAHLTDADAQADGFPTAAEMLTALRAIYPNASRDGRAWFRIAFRPEAGAAAAAANGGTAPHTQAARRRAATTTTTTTTAKTATSSVPSSAGHSTSEPATTRASSKRSATTKSTATQSPPRSATSPLSTQKSTATTAKGVSCRSSLPNAASSTPSARAAQREVARAFASPLASSPEKPARRKATSPRRPPKRAARDSLFD